MGPQRTEMANWLASRRSRASDLAPGEALLLVADACDAAIERKELSKDALRIFVEAGHSQYALVWSPTTTLVQALQSGGVDSTPILRQWIDSKKASARCAALNSITCGFMPCGITDYVLTVGIFDKSAKVRGLAYHAALHYFRKLWMIPLMEESARRYVDKPMALTLLRDGYHMIKMPNGTYEVQVLSRNTAVISRNVPQAVLDQRGIDVILEEIRTEADFQWGKPVAPLPVELHRNAGTNGVATE